ncbi:hypothetical protein SLEP1_g6086 [Rubroshorea leprosula]|uniref:Uncharacterized protein n=1 Tax=Rubroshorea leprosula TaxID=152421 RepID=A0AAV5HU17_9ROSI|nr:hypothetical protein SLEP1_g6086 [Rubroshorea leprosula]
MATHKVLWTSGGHSKKGIMDLVKIPQGCLFSTGWRSMATHKVLSRICTQLLQLSIRVAIDGG